MEMIASHRAYLQQRGVLAGKREERATERVKELVSERLHVEFWNAERNRLLASMTGEMTSQKLTPYDIAERLLENFNR